MRISKWGAALAAGLALLGAAQTQAVELNADPNWQDQRDFDFASRGFIATRADPKITDASGRVVADLSAYDFIKGPAPATVV